MRCAKGGSRLSRPGVQRWSGSRPWTACAPGSRPRPPQLLLVDYRLPQGKSGVDALVAIRASWPQARLPAIVVTGGTLGGHEDEAVTHDYHLLIKPVLPNKARAMIAFKPGLR
jgi:two-component system, sensor histidine kinase